MTRRRADIGPRRALLPQIARFVYPPFCGPGALDRKPDSAPAALVLGQALMGRGDDAGAVRWLEQAVRSSPGDAVVRYALSRVRARRPRRARLRTLRG